LRTSLVVAVLVLAVPVLAGPQEDALLKAVRAGDVAAVKSLLDAGVPADAKYRYDRTALSFAADRGHREIAALLIAKGADVNAKDTYYGITPLVMAAENGHDEMVVLLLEKGAEPASVALSTGFEKEKPALVEAAARSGRLSGEHLSAALALAEERGLAELARKLRDAGATPLPPADHALPAEVLASYAGTYQREGGAELTFKAEGGALVLHMPWMKAPVAFRAVSPTRLRAVDSDGLTFLDFEMEAGAVKGFLVKSTDDKEAQRYTRAAGPAK
jgi:ankyrin repeat protein